MSSERFGPWYFQRRKAPELRCFPSSCSHVPKSDEGTIKSVGLNSDKCLKSLDQSIAIREIMLRDFPNPIESPRIPP